MPLDATHGIPRYKTAEEMYPVYKQRRESAARLWEGVPDRKFVMNSWEQYPFKLLGTQFGYSACALGWLAEKRHDGWCWSRRVAGKRVPQGPDNNVGYSAAESYFGLFLPDADRCFGANVGAAAMHGRWFTSRITGKDVGRTLLELPYRLPMHSSMLNKTFTIVDRPELSYA